jgi:hypothetical protein
LTDVAIKLSAKYGEPDLSSDGTYIWGLSGGLADDVYGITARHSPHAAVFIEVQYVWPNQI